MVRDGCARGQQRNGIADVLIVVGIPARSESDVTHTDNRPRPW